MASKTYFQPTVDGGYMATRSRPQGRPKGSGEGRKPRPFTASDASYAIIVAKAKAANMSASAYIELAAVLYEFS